MEKKVTEVEKRVTVKNPQPLINKGLEPLF